MTTPADRAQLGMWRALVNPPHVSHFAAREVAGLVAIAERAVAEAARLEEAYRAEVAENVTLAALVRDHVPRPQRHAAESAVLPPPVAPPTSESHTPVLAWWRRTGVS